MWAKALIDLHLDPSWSFGFDNAKTRAGLCNYTNKRITVSKYLAARYEDDEIHQVLLHEVAHAIAGTRAGHGARWKSIAAELGYEGKRLHDGAIADELALLLELAVDVATIVTEVPVVETGGAV